VIYTITFSDERIEHFNTLDGFVVRLCEIMANDMDGSVTLSWSRP
jgi:hypothetical protein